MPTENKKNPYSSIVERNAFGLETELEPMVIEFPLDDNSNPKLEITGVDVLNRKRTLSMTGLDNEGERKNYRFRKFTNKATKYKPRWMEIDFKGKPLKNSKITIDDLRMEKNEQGKLKLESVDYRDYNDESPSLKQATWRGKQMPETVVIVEPDTPIATKTIDLPTLPELTNQPDWLPPDNWSPQPATNDVNVKSEGGRVPLRENTRPPFNDWIKQNYPSMQNKIHEPENVLWKEEMEENWSQQP